jgi:hypothetical protein
LSERFWSKVDQGAPDECWPWTACRILNGYGHFRWGGKMTGAHRVAYELTYGSPGVLEVDHTCHNRSCCNPAHLRAVTHKQNTENRCGPQFNSTTGVRGVTFSQNRYEAKVRHNGERIYVGRFVTLAEAEAAVVAKRNELYTHNDLDRS